MSVAERIVVRPCIGCCDERTHRCTGAGCLEPRSVSANNIGDEGELQRSLRIPTWR